MKHLDRIIAFVGVVQRNGFAAAAREMKISTAAVSKQVTALEDSLGVQLLMRTTRRLSLTEAGKVYFEYCEKILEEFREAEASVSQFRKEPRGRLHILCGPQFAERYLLPHLREFVEEHDKITLDIELAQRIPDFISENIDLVLGLALQGPPNCIQRRIATTYNVLLASPDYLKENGTPKKPEELIDHRYIAHSMRVQENLLRFGGGKEIHLSPVMSLNDIRSMVTLAKNGAGIIRVHHYVGEEAVKAGELVEILPEYRLTDIPIYLYYPERRHLPARIRRFIDFVIEKVEGKPPSKLPDAKEKK